MPEEVAPSMIPTDCQGEVEKKEEKVLKARKAAAKRHTFLNFLNNPESYGQDNVKSNRKCEKKTVQTETENDNGRPDKTSVKDCDCGIHCCA
jgi:hypothetical protein